jgi:dCTP diphosphatase
MPYHRVSLVQQLQRLSTRLASRVANSEAASARISGFGRSIPYHFVSSAGATTDSIGSKLRRCWDSSVDYDGRIYERWGQLGLDDLRIAIGAFIRERDWEQFHSPTNPAMALSVEVAEIVEHFQWLTEEQSQNLPPEKLAEIREEIGDVMIYLTELADKLGIDPVEAAEAKVVINGQRYPAELVKGKASKYTEYG